MTGGFDHDLVIVGAGPAGTSTALHLVREERIRPGRILVIDKAAFPRDKPCAGAVSRLGVDALAAVGVRVTVPSVEMAGVRVMTGARVGETRCDIGILVRRAELDAELLERVRGDGVAVRESTPIVALSRIPGGFRVELAGGASVTTRLVAGCDGAGSTTRKLLALPETARKGHLYVLETEPLAVDHGPERGLVDFDLSVLSDGVEGYYWDFPTVIGGARHVSRGIYHANLSRQPEGRRVDVKRALARALARRGLDITKLKLSPFSTRPYVPGSVVSAEGLVLVGEAAGIDRTTGEGIAQALVMGGMAARHLARALRTGGRSFASYARALERSTIGRHMLQSAWLSRRVYGRRVGHPARELLLRSGYARDAAMRWYRGEHLAWSTQVRLGFGLVAPALA